MASERAWRYLRAPNASYFTEERVREIEAVQNALRKPTLPLSLLSTPETPGHELLASLAPATTRVIHIPPRNISITFATTQWIPCIISGIAVTSTGTTIAFYQHEGSLAHSFRIL